MQNFMLHSIGQLTAKEWLCRTRLIMPGKHGRLMVAVEVLPIVPGISMVEVVKVIGNSIDFYSFYAGLTQQVMTLTIA